jgi:hypothetical protein
LLKNEGKLRRVNELNRKCKLFCKISQTTFAAKQQPENQKRGAAAPLCSVIVPDFPAPGSVHRRSL